MIAHFHLNWLAPVKVRKTLVGGTRKMIVYDDMEPIEKVRVYDNGITVNHDPEVGSECWHGVSQWRHGCSQSGYLGSLASHGA